jgi:hypothetical protein
MPKYTNTTLSNITLGQHNIGPGESITIQEYFSAKTGITIDNTVGYYDPIIYSNATATGTISIPATSSAYEVKFVGGVASGTIKYNSSSATAQVIAPGEVLKEKCYNRVIDSVIISGTVYMTVRKI